MRAKRTKGKKKKIKQQKQKVNTPAYHDTEVKK